MSRTETRTAHNKGSSCRWAHRLSVHVAAVGKVLQRQYLIWTKCKCEASSCACSQSTYESRYAAGTQAVICHCSAEVITLLQRWLWSHRGDYNMTSWSGAERLNINYKPANQRQCWVETASLCVDELPEREFILSSTSMLQKSRNI